MSKLNRFYSHYFKFKKHAEKGTLNNEKTKAKLSKLYANYLKNYDGEDVWGVRNDSAHALAEIGGLCVVTQIIDMLDDEELSSLTAGILRKIDKEAVLAPLIDVLKTKGRLARTHAAELLGEIGDARAEQPLLAALHDEHAAVREKAVWALYNISGARVLDSLIAALRDKSQNVRYYAAKALYEIGDARAFEPLTDAMDDPYHYVREYAIKALAKMDAKRAKDTLRRTLADPDASIRHFAAEEIYQLREKKWKYIVMKGDSCLVELAKTKNELFFEPLLLGLHAEKSKTRTAAAAALGLFGDPRATEPLIRALKDQDPDVREHAAYALGLFGDSRAAEPLIRALGDEYGTVIKNAAFALGRCGDARAVEPLIGALGNRRKGFMADSQFVRENAAFALGKLGDTRAIQPLTLALVDWYKDVRQNAADALSALGQPKWKDMIEDAPNSLFKICETHDPMFFEPLVSQLEIATFSEVVTALGILGDHRATQPLLKLLKFDAVYDKFNGVVAQALGCLGDPTAIAPLEKLSGEMYGRVARAKANYANRSYTTEYWRVLAKELEQTAPPIDEALDKLHRGDASRRP